MEGTYIVDGTITIPNNTTLAGAGPNTKLKLKNSQGGFMSIITALDTTTGTNITIRDITIDGNKALNPSGLQSGIILAGIGGAGTTPGANLLGLTVKNFRDSNIILSTAYNTKVSGSTISGSSQSQIELSGAGNVTITNNNLLGSGVGGVSATGSSGNTNSIISNNYISGNAYGLGLSAGSNYTIVGNIITGSSSNGIKMQGTDSTISGNRISDSNGSTDNYGINLNAADSNIVTGNIITDTDGHTISNYALRISNGSDNNYIANNTLGGGTILDGGSGTIYGGQLDVSGNYMIQPAGTVELMKDTNVTGILSVKASSATAFNVQNSSNQTVLSADTSANQVLFGQASALTGVLAIANSTNGNLVKLTAGVTSGTGYTLVLPTVGVAGSSCLQSTSGSTTTNTALQWGSCGGGGGGGATRTVVLVPEYAGGTLHADGGDNTGTMISDYVSGLISTYGYKHNYYEWSSSDGTTAQDYDIVINTAIPSEYASSLANFKIWVQSSNTTNTPSATMRVNDVDGTLCGGAATSIVPGSTNWEQISISSLSSCSFAANDVITITVHVTSKSNATFRAGEVSFTYTN
jgi:hypothetical protein